ncbi:MAG: acyltransferase [Dehalococcoidales bacterium]|nr:acyltransferase [Dehalococcoidales bacterium]
MQKILDYISFLFHTIKGDSLWIMKRRGLKVGKNLFLGGSYLDLGLLHLITIGDNVTLAGRVTVLAHDASMNEWLGYSKIGKVVIGNRVFIGYGSIVLPGVTIGDDAVIGAGSVVTKNVPSGRVAIGNPAKDAGSLEDFLSKKREELDTLPVFGQEYLKLNKKKRREMLERMRDGWGYMI